jgi:Tfp pilus assembly protein PilF
MNRRSCASCAIVVLACILAARGQAAAPSASASNDSSQEAAVIQEMSTRVSFDNEGNISREQNSRVLVQTDAGVQQWGLLVFPFQSASQTIEVDYVRVRKPNGTVLATPPDNVQDLDSEVTRNAPFYSDLREKHVAVKGLGKGDILEYQAHWHPIKPLIPGEFWFQYIFQHKNVVLNEQVEVRVPVDRQVKVKGPQSTQTVTSEAGFRVYRWSFSQPQKPKPDSGQQELDAALGLLPPPDIQVSSFQTWDAVGRWYWNLQKDRAEPTPAIRAKAAELTKGSADNSAKLRAIYSFVSTQYRYIGVSFGIGRYQPHSAEDVLSNNYGDCKDKHTLLAALLQASGITLYPALISSNFRLDPDVPSPAQFDHIVGYLPANDKEQGALWLDTTPEVSPLAYLVPKLRDKEALVMLGEKSAQLVGTPPDPPEPDSAVFQIEAKLNDNGTLDAKMQRTDRGDSAVMLRSAFRSVGQPGWKDLMQKISYGSGYGGTVSDVDVSSMEAITEPLHIAYSYTRKDYPDWTNHHITAPIAAFFLPPAAEGDSQPKQPVWLGSSMELDSEAKVELPKGYTPQPPAEVNLKYDFAEYHSTYSISDGNLVVRRHLLTKAREIPVSRLDDYKAFNKDMLNDASRYVEMSSTSSSVIDEGGQMQQKAARFRTAIEALPDSRNEEAKSHEQDALNAISTYDVTRAEYGLKKAVEKDPKFTRAWLRLAVLYLGLAATTDAVSTLQKAIDSDPSKPISYRIAAVTFTQLQQPDEAIKTWQDLLKIVPDDSEAVSDLGPLLMQQKRYKDALPYLETFAREEHSSAAQIQLGAAYLKNGQVEKGTGVLDKVLESDTAPLVWNDAAYELADENADLPKALEYAQKAVDQQEKDCGGVDLSNLRRDDLSCVVKIGAYWDTLGWADFKSGHTQEAEEYLTAAWLLTQFPVNADHLGQVYESEGKTQKAIHMYRLALAASGPHSTDVASEATRRRLAHLSGSKVPAPSAFARDTSFAELSQLRTVKLKRLLPGSESAEFFILLGPGAKVESVHFISGSEKLKLAAEQVLPDTTFPVSFPKTSSARLVRRAIVNCSPVSGCQAVLLTPSTVKLAN